MLMQPHQYQAQNSLLLQALQQTLTALLLQLQLNHQQISSSSSRRVTLLRQQ
jgi:hypothetical protein